MNKEKAKEIIDNIFHYTNCTISKCEFSDEAGICWCSIETPDSSFIIGRDGETLRSLNHIVQKILDKGLEEKDNSDEHIRNSVFIDINGYQKKRFDNLKAIAHMMAERARYFKSNIEIDPMPAYERKVIHMFLEGAKDIKTESDGYGSNRHIVIKYIGNNIL